MSLLQVRKPLPKEIDLTRVYDAIVIGSGAAGGMAAHVLTSQGLKVLLLEAGRKLDIDDGAQVDGVAVRPPAPRRHAARSTTRCRSTSTTSARRPMREGLPHEKVYSYVAGLERLRLQQEHRRRREGASVHGHATTRGCARAAWAARPTSGDGWRCGCRDFDFKAKTHDGYGEDWPISYADIAPYYDRGRSATSGISGVKENLPHLPDSIFQRPYKLNARGGHAAQDAAEDGPRR